MTENPRKHDVLCGRGGATNSHTGNVEYRSLVQGHQDGYLHAAKSEKKEIARSIVATIRSRGGRFLRKCTDGRVGWLEIGDKKAREKTSQALREGLDAKTLLAKGIVKADLLAEIATTSEGPPPTKRRRRSSDADVASSEAWGGGVEARNQHQLLQMELEADACSPGAADADDDTLAAAPAAANKATASPELVAEAAPAYYDYGSIFSLNGLNGASDYYALGYPVSHPVGAYHPGESGAFEYVASAPIGAGMPGVGAYCNDTTASDLGSGSGSGSGLDYGTDETDLYASGAREFDVPPPPIAGWWQCSS